MADETLSNLLYEDRRFEPPKEPADNANVKEEAYDRAASDREAFWAEQDERLDWGQKWDQSLKAVAPVRIRLVKQAREGAETRRRTASHAGT